MNASDAETRELHSQGDSESTPNLYVRDSTSRRYWLGNAPDSELPEF
jgi:hypothetical protein